MLTLSWQLSGLDKGLLTLNVGQSDNIACYVSRFHADSGPVASPAAGFQ